MSVSICVIFYLVLIKYSLYDKFVILSIVSKYKRKRNFSVLTNVEMSLGTGRAVKEPLDERNGFFCTVKAGSKGSLPNIGPCMDSVGQQNLSVISIR